LDPNGFAPVRSNCSVTSPGRDTFRLDDKVYPSPDGRWWAHTGEHGVALYDAETVWTDATPAAPASYSAVWVDSSASFVVVTQTEVLRMYVDGRPNDTVPLPASGVGGTIRPIRDLR
jgi:hypothetical protein